jgi:phosphoribosyl-ATP pyrophosphohydrolase
MKDDIFEKLMARIEARKAEFTSSIQKSLPPSYVRDLFSEGLEKIVAKISEESQEFQEALQKGDSQHIVHEAADLLFHIFVGLVDQNISLSSLQKELDNRFGISGIEEKARRPE